MKAGLRRLRGTAIAVCVVTVVLTGTVSDTAYDKQQQLQGLNGRIIGSKTQLKVLIDEEQRLKQEIAALESELTTIAEQIQQETAKLELLGLQIEIAKRQLVVKEAELKQHVDDFGKRMRLMYKSGRISGLELVLSANNFTDLLNRVIFFNDIIRDDRHQVDALKLEQLQIEAMKADLDAKHALQAQVVKTIQDQQSQLQAVRDQRVGDRQKIAAVEAQVQRQLDEMVAQRASLQAQIARLVSESLRARSSGKWKWPMDGLITQGFGCTTLAFEPYDPNCLTRHFHSGIDIATDFGTPVHAADGGIVHNFSTGCSWNPSLLCGYGHYVIVVHQGGFTSLYGHLSGWAVADGTQVAKDTVIGFEGTTGASTGPHLHFEIDLSGIPVDPLAYLPLS